MKVNELPQSQGIGEALIVDAEQNSGAHAPDMLPVSPQIVWRLQQLDTEFSAVLKAYQSTGETQPVERLRDSARNKLGFSLGLQARNDQERALFVKAGRLLEELETSFPDVPMSPEMSARYKKLRTWAQEGGQFAILVARRGASRRS